MKRIFKYQLEIIDSQDITMPAGAKILSVQGQKENICVWALVNPYAKESVRTFTMYGTGQLIHNEEIIRSHQYIGTVQTEYGSFVWHVWVTPT